MGYDRPTLTELDDRIFQDFATRFNPMVQSTRYNLLRILSKVDAGKYHQLYGDLSFVSRQIFPDTSEAEFLRAHWSDRVPPNYAVAAIGSVVFTGTNGATIPEGLLLGSAGGHEYYLESQVVIAGGTGTGQVKALEAGAASNLEDGAGLSISSAVPSGIAATATVSAGGIAGGVDPETDAAYLARVLLYIRNGSRYGRPGDFAAWAIDSSSGVSNAFEIKNFGPMGALLIQVIGGNHTDGVTQVGNLDVVREYIETVAPPTVFTVMTPDLLTLNPAIHLVPAEDTVANRDLVIQRLRGYLELTSAPGMSYTAAVLRDAIVDGVVITDASVTIDAAVVYSTVLQLFTLGAPTWV